MRRGELGLGDVGGVLGIELVRTVCYAVTFRYAYLVGVVGSGGSGLALLARGELREVAVVISLPATYIVSILTLVLQVHVAPRKMKE